uniref:MG2 domain-containing protein n=1 Tax=Chryseobacterium foetidum TaxID=2951057 RepID=UPI00294FF48C|nr:alpha-2-macroglobulin family protein [Chryseobacterium foetidum]
MKSIKLILILLYLGIFSTFQAQNYYDTQWEKIKENTNAGKFKSNLPIITEIQTHAMKENKTIELIKALKSEYAIIFEISHSEENDLDSKFFAKIRATEQQLKGDDRLFFKILVSDFLQEYYGTNSWKINDHTNINQQDVSSIETWSKLDFKNHISKSHQELDQMKAELKKIDFSKYKKVFYNTSSIEFFPTLYDWYALEKINFLKNLNFFTPNELAENKIEISKIYDELIASNSRNSKLYFSHEKVIYDCVNTSCKNKVGQLYQLANSPVEGDYKVLIYEDIAQTLTLEDKEKDALAAIEKAKKDFPKSLFLNNLKNIENRIVIPSLNITYEDQTQPNVPIHFSAEFKNVENFSINIYKPQNVNEFFSYKNKNSLDGIKKTLVRKDEFKLNNPKDYKTYRTSLEIKPLPAGIYFAEFVVENDKDNLKYQHFYFLVSENKILYQTKSDEGDLQNLLKLVNSENGNVAGEENLIIYEFSGDKKLSETKLLTDKNGIFKFPLSENKEFYRRYLITQPKTNSFQMMSVYGHDRNQYNQEKNAKKAQIFTDRAIYRPGQKVYFKVINTQIANDKESVAANTKQKISLVDANNQEISSQEFTTNEFGSYHGSFILPKGKLNGSFTIKTEGFAEWNKYIQVEEYKRPKFEVTFEPIKSEYKYGETLELKGKVMMFSGVALSNTTVNYEIKKQNIRWKYFSWFPRDYDNENSILGDVKTDDKGEFTIKVDLQKDDRIDGIQIDNFAVNASVTDINGETQSANTNIKVASVSHYIKTDEIKNVFDDENVKLKVETKNYNEQNLKKSYQIKLSKLRSPERIFRSNFEDYTQNLPQYSKAEFVNKFPHDRFDKNDDDDTPKIESVILSKTVTQKEVEASQDLNLGKLETGNYELELFNIEGKDTIRTKQKFSVFSKKSVGKEQNIFLEVVQPKTELNRGETSDIYVYSSIPNAAINVFFQDGINSVISSVHHVKNGVFKFPVTAPLNEKISDLNITFQIVAFNDIQTKTVSYNIVDSSKDMTIETVTFRDKIEPNSKEKWTVKVSGNDKEKVNAEVLANMYDMSLDQFNVNKFDWNTLKISYDDFKNYSMQNSLQQGYYEKNYKYLRVKSIGIPELNWLNYSLDEDLDYQDDGPTPYREYLAGDAKVNHKIAAAPQEVRLQSLRMDDEAIEIVNSGRQLTKAEKMEYTDVIDPLNAQEKLANTVPVRQNLNETAFFYPDLKTDKEGNVSFKFTSPEALTKWKLMFLAHTKDARAATLEKQVVTQKEFSVTPNYPRFLREGDELSLQSKLSNLTDKKLSGNAQLQILDAFTNEDITDKFGLIRNNSSAFELKENGNSSLTWKIVVPKNVSSIILKVVAKAGNYSDGEQKAVAVLPNRMLVTEAVPIFVKEGETKTFELENLKNNSSTTISNVSNTLELTTNPIWEIMFALPGLKNDQNSSADVVFNKWFADVLASEIFKANPKLKIVFEQYQNKGLLTSNLEKNQELKQMLLDETPWVLESKNETEQMQKLALLFDANTMKNSISQDWDELKKLQNPDGGFSWYQGYPSSYSTSLYILKNLGKINLWLKDNVKDYQSSEQKDLVKKLIQYVDQEVGKYNVKKENVWTNWTLYYLNTRNYWEKEYPLTGKSATLKSLVKEKAKTAKIRDFTFFGLHRAALLMNDYGLKEVSEKLLTYLKETSVDTKNQGVYWKQNLDDWGWFSSKVVNHAGALEAFSTLKPTDQKFIEDLKIWLITQKEVNSWGSSRGTAEVIFTILNSGKSWTTAESDKATIIWGGKELKLNSESAPLSLGERSGERITGYVKSSLKKDVVDKKLATVTITKPGAGIVQGGLFWQYYEDLDKIKSSENYLSVTKELYKK